MFDVSRNTKETFRGGLLKAERFASSPTTRNETIVPCILKQKTNIRDLPNEPTYGLIFPSW
jgi:hypothetical protein